jgi:hypothetical protein
MIALTQQFNKHKIVLHHHFPYLESIHQGGPSVSLFPTGSLSNVHLQPNWVTRQEMTAI